MEEGEDCLGQAGPRNLWPVLAVYAVAGVVAPSLLLVARQALGLPQTLDNGLIAALLAGLIAMVLLLRTRIVGSRLPILHALEAFAVVLSFAAVGLLIAYLLGPAGTGLSAIIS